MGELGVVAQARAGRVVLAALAAQLPETLHVHVLRPTPSLLAPSPPHVRAALRRSPPFLLLPPLFCDSCPLRTTACSRLKAALSEVGPTPRGYNFECVPSSD